MRHRTAFIAVALAVLVGCVATSLLVRTNGEQMNAAIAAASAPLAVEGHELLTDDPRTRDDRRPNVREVSQSFRHTSFLVAIRRAGFYCDDVIAAHETVEGVWLASCRDRGGFKIAVDGIDGFDVEPIPHNVDAVF